MSTNYKPGDVANGYRLTEHDGWVPDGRPRMTTRARRILGPVAVDNATIYTLVGLALAVLVIVAVGQDALMVIGVLALPFIALGGVIYLAVKHGVRNGRSNS